MSASMAGRQIAFDTAAWPGVAARAVCPMSPPAVRPHAADHPDKLWDDVSPVPPSVCGVHDAGCFESAERVACVP